MLISFSPFTLVSLLSLIGTNQTEKDQSLRNSPGKYRVGFRQKVPRNVGGIWMFWSVVWFCSQISKVKSTVFYSSKVERNSWASHYTSGPRHNAKTESTFIRRIKEAFPLFYVTDLQSWSARWTASTHKMSRTDFSEIQSQKRHHSIIDRNIKENNGTMAQPGSKLRSWNAEYLTFLYVATEN